MAIALEALKARIDSLLKEKGSVLIAIDGPCGAGKSTLGEALLQAYGQTGAALFHMDDFFLQPRQRTRERLSEPGGNVDRERFAKEVLLPLRSGQPFTYRRYDCGSGAFVQVQARPARLSVVEGVYSLHPELRAAYDLKVFLDIGSEAQKERLKRRVTPEKFQRFLDEWIPLEERYFESFRVREAADLLISK